MENLLREKYWVSIEDLSLKLWIRISKTNDLKWFRKDYDIGTPKQDLEAYTLVYDEFYKEYGIGKDHERLNELKKEKIELECDFVINNDRFLLNAIRQIEAEIEDIMNRNVGISIDEMIIHLENWRKFPIDEEKTSVKKFYDILKTYEKTNKNG